MNGAVSRSRSAEVLVVGAGPTGLALALVMARLGVAVRIVDQKAGVAPYSRALGVHARTLEFYRQLGFADDVIDAGVVATTANLWARRQRVARVPFDDIGAGLTRYPFVLDFAQDAHERLLVSRLAAANVQVEWGTSLVRLEEAGDGVRAVLRRSGGDTETCQVRYVAGCDGSHSTVRGSLGIDFGGGTYQRLFYVADVVASGPTVDDGVNVALDDVELLVVFDMKGPGRVRLVGTIRAESAEEREREWTFDDIGRRPIDRLGLEVTQVNWFSTYHVHHRVAGRFRAGRAFLLGDAAHVHSPVGAQGMNTGIGDAVNLAWKLADVLHGRASPALLDTYEPERIAFARRLVATTDRAFEIATRRGRAAALIRTRIFPAIVSIAFRIPAVRRFVFRTVSQIEINYRDSAISRGRAGAVCGGDRLPWVPPPSGQQNDNHSPLASWRWQVHRYGQPAADLEASCRELGLEYYEFPWRPAMGSVGLRRDALYLIRPDGHVALADPTPSAARLRSFVERIRANGHQ